MEWLRANHWDQWFSDGFGVRQPLEMMVFDGCAPLVRRWNGYVPSLKSNQKWYWMGSLDFDKLIRFRGVKKNLHCVVPETQGMNLSLKYHEIMSRLKIDQESWMKEVPYQTLWPSKPDQEFREAESDLSSPWLFEMGRDCIFCISGHFRTFFCSLAIDSFSFLNFAS